MSVEDFHNQIFDEKQSHSLSDDHSEYQHETNDANDSFHYMQSNEEKYEQQSKFVSFIKIESVCFICNESFSSRTKLHFHLRKNCRRFQSNILTFTSVSSLACVSSKHFAVKSFTITSHVEVIEFLTFTNDLEFEFNFKA